MQLSAFIMLLTGPSGSYAPLLAHAVCQKNENISSYTYKQKSYRLLLVAVARIFYFACCNQGSITQFCNFAACEGNQMPYRLAGTPCGAT